MAVYLFVLILVFAYLSGVVEVLDNGLARRPPMGWMSWGYYMCGVDCDNNPHKCLDEKLILSVADKFYTEGYQEAGFEYIIIDDCWSEKARDDNGRLVADKKRFPRGMKYIADYIHKLGLKFGMYTNIATKTCMGYPGSRGHFEVDAKMFAEWDVDYLKVDGCFVKEDYLNTAYIKLGAHLNATGRPMVYSCSWPYYIQFIHHKKPDYGAVSRHCNVWRSYHDVATSWPVVKAIIAHYATQYEHLYRFHGPGHWNDPDMLIFGTNSLTDSQSRVHIAVYAMLAAPLLLSCDMNSLNTYEKKLLLNLDLIAIAQDPLGVMAKPYVLQYSVTLWVKPHLPRKGDKYHSVSFALVNLSKDETTVSFIPGHYGLNSTDGYTVMDIFAQVFIKNISLSDSFQVSLSAEDSLIYTMFPL
ncbi:alpha-N-acetylgalactosaminidase [Bicyclus anynana]|uniref:Alpha-galactosidase n=1 Tax=Bicyclus anynana TaxID=110368 RepID=A0A6J1P1N0_BICAN|nr:alpha-N-acetylgalactosaminidase [Bicyclus anynana]